MILEIPILIQPRAGAEDRAALYAVRPLFFEGPEYTDRDLSKAIARLGDALVQELRSLARSGNHTALAAYSFSPYVQLHWLDLRLELRSGMFRGWFPLATFEHQGRTIAFSPYLLDAWFEVAPQESLAERAAAVYTRYFRDLHRQRDEQEVERRLEPFRSKKRPWLSLLDVSVDTRAALGEPTEQRFALLGGTEQMDGAEELRRVGQCLQRLYPDRLERALQRDASVQELQELLSTSDNRPVLLVGPPLVGKTTLIHEVVYRDTERRRETHTAGDPKRDVWLVAPQRLVTGMSYVGQWENRLLAILRHVRKRKHILYFDDLLGLYQAGITSQSNLSAADVLKPYIERHEIRLLAEMTPEQLRVFRERDRGFADLFHVVHVEEPAEEPTVRILLGAVRALEARYRVRFAIEVLPTVLDLARRYQRDAAFPGKAARWLGQLAVKFQDRDVTRQDTLEEFRAKSGLELAFLDTGAKLKRQEILAALRTRIVGQQEAVEAMADVVTVAKARLNDPQRPWGTLFFLGPTGVGKTECAKALAGYLFGDASRLLRFDMNEFVSPHSAARLAGTFDQPEGLLTGAIRRQPFCVLLFDEIEKAHPDVFDLLLQILGEARLTDALGRTADFGNAVVILTSNLGTRQASRELGFGAGERSAETVYHKAVEDFFRPEFFNRLDRIVPFQRLNHAELGQIAQSIVREIMSRAGLAQRKCAVDLAGDALDWVVDQGYHPTLGARAMRRAVERELVRPLSRQLAAVLPETPTVLRVSRRGNELAAEVTPLVEAEPRPESARPEKLGDPQDILARAVRVLDRVEQACQSRRPPGEIQAGRLSPEFSWFLGVAECLKDTRARMREIAESLRAPTSVPTEPLLRPKPGRQRTSLSRDYGKTKHRRILKELYAAQDVLDYIKGLAAEFDAGPGVGSTEQALRELLDQLALLDALRPDDDGWTRQRVLVLVRSLDDDAEFRARVARGLREEFTFASGGTWDERCEVEFGLEATWWPPARPNRSEALRDELGGESDREYLARVSLVSQATGKEPPPGWLEWVTDPELQSACRARHHLDVMLFEGHQADRWLRLEQGTHLFVTADGRLKPLQVIPRLLRPDEQVERVLLDWLAEHGRYQEALVRGETPAFPDPFAWQSTVALCAEGGLCVHFCSGLRTRGGLGWGRVRTLRASLPLPPEFPG
jgi:ATP-dependent Clp protease ATP-binding subunit ClpA